MQRFDHNTLLAHSKSPQIMAEWLGQWHFDRFVTLTMNRPGDGMAATVTKTSANMRDRLKQFDARMNRKLIGSSWHKQPENRMFHFFAPEKIGANPHWHGLIRFWGATSEETARQGKVFDQNLESIWRYLVPAGSVNSQPINYNAGAVDYVSKSLFSVLNFEHCVFPDEFILQ